MNFNIKRSVLLPCLQSVSGNIERRQTLPILSNLLFDIKPNSLSITATDMEVELVIMNVEVNFDQAARFTLPGKKLYEICQRLPEDATIELDIQENKAQIKSGKSRFTLSTLPAQEFPIIDVTDETIDFKLSHKKLTKLLTNTQFAMAQQDVRYYLNGLMLEILPDKIKAVATDGHRLAYDETDIQVPAASADGRQIIVPRKGGAELIRLLQASQSDADIKISKNHLHVISGNLSFTSKLIDGKFPDYQRVIPELSDTTVVADRENLKNSLGRASILSNEKYRGVKISFSDNTINILAHNPEKEEAKEEVGVTYQGNEMEIGFNVSYLVDALKAIDTEKVKLSVLDPNSSCLIIPEGESNCRYVVMPMKL